MGCESGALRVSDISRVFIPAVGQVEMTTEGPRHPKTVTVRRVDARLGQRSLAFGRNHRVGDVGCRHQRDGLRPWVRLNPEGVEHDRLGVDLVDRHHRIQQVLERVLRREEFPRVIGHSRIAKQLVGQPEKHILELAQALPRSLGDPQHLFVSQPGRSSLTGIGRPQVGALGQPRGSHDQQGPVTWRQR